MTEKQKTIGRAIFAAILVAGLLVLGRMFDVPAYLRTAMVWIDSLGFVGVFVFIALYATLTVLLVPGTIPTFAAGAIFGVVQGTIYVSLGSTLGATLAFFIGRYLARDVVRRAVSGRPRFAAIDQAIGREGWKIVGLLRLSPVVPFSMSNYFYGITAVPPRGYILASWIGMLPGTILYVYIGTLFGIAATGRGMTTEQWIFTAVGLVATVVVTIYISRLARNAINRKVDVDIDTT